MSVAKFVGVGAVALAAASALAIAGTNKFVAAAAQCPTEASAAVGTKATTASGLAYEIVKAGSGACPGVDDTVLVHYEGRLTSGEIFDSSVQRGQPAAFPVGGLIPGWTEGLQLMKTGAKYRFVIPSNLAYGAEGAGGVIPPNATLLFEVELLAIAPKDAPAG
jgi:FKBP-type peptidyl-prolyl cis-trans isomerase FkpA/FKBP-type peptidyl-prolyl cis-trans isomerase FklB